MRITDVEALLLRQPGEIDAAAADGSQDGLLVRVHTDEGLIGIGEVDSSPSVAKAITLPEREPPSALITSLGDASSMREASAPEAKPPNTTQWMAPMRTQASMAITASATMGM